MVKESGNVSQTGKANAWNSIPTKSFKPSLAGLQFNENYKWWILIKPYVLKPLWNSDALATPLQKPVFRAKSSGSGYNKCYIDKVIINRESIKKTLREPCMVVLS